EAVAVGDLNGDGVADIAAPDALNNQVSVLLGTGSGSFGPAANFPVEANAAPQSVAVGDLNGDGNPDIVTANTNTQDLSVLLGTGSGSCGPPTNLGPTHGLPLAVAVGDFNGDGKPDLAGTNVGTNDVSIRLGTGLGAFG